jgi:DNA-binding XRE family transcriptional regulator
MTIKIKRKDFLLKMAKGFLSQKALAEKLQITPQAVNGFLNERYNIGIETAKKVCELFSCEFEELFEVKE